MKKSIVSKLSEIEPPARGPLVKWILAHPDLLEDLNDAVDSWIDGKLPQFSNANALLKAMAGINGEFSSINRSQFTEYSKRRVAEYAKRRWKVTENDKGT